jgi:hypothetical protein
VESAERSATQRAKRPAAVRSASSDPARARGAARSSGGLTIRREARAEDDGYRSALAPGLRSTPDALRLAEQIAYAAGRLATLASDPPGIYAEVARTADLEQATWLAFLIAYLGLLEEGADPFATVRATQTTWASGSIPDPGELPLGARAAHEHARGDQTILAYRRWAERAGSQSAGFLADPSWTPQQRFERVFERLALPGLHRRARYDLLVTLGALGRYPLTASSLLLGEDDAVSRAAKRVFGIGDRLTLERRASELAAAIGVPIEALDLALENWARETRLSLGVEMRDEDVLARAHEALDC